MKCPESEERLTAELRALAKATEAAEAPPGVEAALLAQFDQARRKATWFPRPLRWAAGFAATVTLALMLRPPAADVPPAAAVRFTPPAAPVAQASEPVAQVKPRPAVQRKRRATPRVQQARVEETTTPFYPFTPGDDLSLIERGQIVRVSLPGAALAPFGVPLPEHRVPARLNADVLIGEDGAARGIRLVGFRGR